MLKFTIFINEEMDPMSTEVRQEAGTNPNPPAPHPTPPRQNLNQRITDFVSKYKSGSSGTTTASADPLTLKISTLGLNQAIDIKLENNIHIKAIVRKTQNKKYCELIDTNMSEKSLLYKETPNTGIKDAAGNDLRSEQKKIYFQTFRDKTNKKLTRFYFYNNLDFITNTKASPVFFKSFIIQNII